MCGQPSARRCPCSRHRQRHKTRRCRGNSKPRYQPHWRWAAAAAPPRVMHRCRPGYRCRHGKVKNRRAAGIKATRRTGSPARKTRRHRPPTRCPPTTWVDRSRDRFAQILKIALQLDRHFAIGPDRRPIRPGRRSPASAGGTQPGPSKAVVSVADHEEITGSPRNGVPAARPARESR